MIFVLEKKMIPTSAFFAFTSLVDGGYRWTEHARNAKHFATRLAAEACKKLLQLGDDVVVSEWSSTPHG